MNMSYCIFENTNLAMKQAVDKLDEVINESPQLNTDEARAMIWLIESAVDLLELAQQCTARPILHDEFDLKQLLASMRPYADAASRPAVDPDED